MTSAGKPRARYATRAEQLALFERASISHVAELAGVDYQTARRWYHGASKTVLGLYHWVRLQLELEEQRHRQPGGSDGG